MTNTANSELFLDYETLRLITGWSENNIKVMKSRGKFQTVKYVESGRGGINGTKPLISLADPAIPPQARLKYYELKGAAPVQSSLTENEADSIIYAKAPEFNRKKADKYLALIKLTEGMKGDQLRQFITQEWNVKYPDFKTSYPRLIDAISKYKQNGISALLGNYGKSSGETKIEEEWYEHYKTLYMKEGGPSVKSCWMQTLGYFSMTDKSITVEEFPHPNSFDNLLKNRIPKSAICLAREGEQAYNRNYANYIERDSSEIISNDVWVTDHAQIDVSVFGLDGKPGFPWLTAFSDFKSGKFMGWNIHMEAPNSDHIFLAFHSAAETYGIPKHIYMDNGKDFRCKDFAGGRPKFTKVLIDEKSKQMSTLRMLGIEPHFSLPYNGQTKPIERIFNTNKEYFSKHMVGYRGGDVTERPEILAKEVKDGLIFHFNEFVTLFDKYIEDVLNVIPSAGKNHKGLSRNQLFNSEVKEIRSVRPDALMLFCMRTTNALTIMRNGVLDSQIGSRYWAEWMSGMKGKKVYLRRDIKKYQEAWVFDAENEEFIGHAVLAESASTLANTDIQRQMLRNLTAQKKQDMKVAQSYLTGYQSIDSSDKIAHAAAGAKLLQDANGHKTSKHKKVIRLANTRMDDIVHQSSEMKRTGTDDFSAMIPKEKIKAPVFEFEYERLAWEKRNKK